MGKTTVSNFLHSEFPFYPPKLQPGDHHPSTSKKGWAQRFPKFEKKYVTVHQPTVESVDQFLGPGLEHGQRPPSAVDNIGFQNPVYPLNTAGSESIQSEGDADRIFYQLIEPYFRQAFVAKPTLLVRSQSGPPGRTNSNVTVDYQLTWPGQDRRRERATMIGEFKRPHVIIPEEWTGPEDPGLKTHLLHKEMRG